MDKERYCAAMVMVDGPVHLGRVVDDVVFSVCSAARHEILLPVAYGEVECLHCVLIMKRRGIKPNVTFGIQPCDQHPTKMNNFLLKKKQV